MNKVEKVKSRRNVYKILFIISLVVVLAGGGVLAWIIYDQDAKKDAYANSLKNTYVRNFTELSASMNEIDVNLTKLLASSTNTARQKVLLTIWRDCSSCQANLSNLPIDHESIKSTLSFVNQLGEYCYYLSDKLITETNFSSDDYATIEQLSTFSNTINHDLSLMALNIANGNFDILYNFSGSELAELGDFLNNITEITVDTPSMIYDGPYSENATARKIQGLGSETCTVEQAQQYVADMFGVDMSSISYTGQTSGNFETYNFEFSSNGVTNYAQVTVSGKFLLQYNRQTADGIPAITRDKAIQAAKDFFDKLGIKNMQANWINITDNEILLNFAPEIQGVMIYSDLIKMKISAVDGSICGYEAVSYAYNHTARTIKDASLTRSEAEEIISDKLLVENVRMCIIPKEFSQEVFAYEFTCSYNTYTYYVYVNAETGKEEEIFRVIQDENEGELII